MRFLASMPELCDVTFLVGDTREPVCAVRAVLAARSRYSHPKYQLSARCPCRAQLVQPSKIAAKCVLSLPRAAGKAFQNIRWVRSVLAARSWYRLTKYQLSKGRRFIIENPYGSDPWELRSLLICFLDPMFHTASLTCVHMVWRTQLAMTITTNRLALYTIFLQAFLILFSDSVQTQLVVLNNITMNKSKVGVRDMADVHL